MEFHLSTLAPNISIYAITLRVYPYYSPFKVKTISRFAKSVIGAFDEYQLLLDYCATGAAYSMFLQIVQGSAMARVKDRSEKPVKGANNKGARDMACNIWTKEVATCGLATDSLTAKGPRSGI